MKKKKIGILIAVIAIVAFLLSYIISYANTGETIYVNLTKLDTKGVGYGIGNPANGTSAGGHATSAYIWNLTTYDTSTSTKKSILYKGKLWRFLEYKQRYNSSI